MKSNNRWFHEESTLQILNVLRKMSHSLEGINRAVQTIERRGVPARAAEPADRDPTVLRKIFDKAWPKK